MVKISITNIVALNGGDTAILLGMISALKRRFGVDTRFVVFATCPQLCKKLYPEIEWKEIIGNYALNTRFNNIPLFSRLARKFKLSWIYLMSSLYGNDVKWVGKFINKKLLECIKIYSESDYIISTGGTYLTDIYGVNSQYCDYRISLNLKRPLIFYTQSMGPFFKKNTKNKLGKILEQANAVFLRDNQSKKNLNSLKLQRLSNVHIAADAAFALGNKEHIRTKNTKKIGEHKKVAISVRKWGTFNHHSESEVMTVYRESIAKTVINLIDHGFNVCFISTCQGLNEYDDDNKEVNKILEIIPNEYLTSITKFNKYLSIHEIRTILRNMDFIISTRLHMCILSLIEGIPVFPIAYEFKTKELFNQLGYTKVISMEGLFEESLLDNVTKFMNEYDRIRLAINERVISCIDNSLNTPYLI